MNGVVIKKGVELGETVTSGVSSFNAGTVLFTVADLESLIIRVNLNEVDIAKVSVGQPVRITLDAYPQKVFTGKVRFVAPAAKLVEKIKVFEVEVALDELADAFRTGMSANVEILGEQAGRRRSRSRSRRSSGRTAQTVVYRLKENLDAEQLAKAKEGLAGRGKFIWLSDHWKEYFDASRSRRASRPSSGSRSSRGSAPATRSASRTRRRRRSRRTTRQLSHEPRHRNPRPDEGLRVERHRGPRPARHRPRRSSGASSWP